ncbi:RNA polymerase sigma factor SigW [Rubeoparvulum massiliense]|uniref:RNA polymerase sigma factor SigW n=1 Tax=Rubeoparvulum massiliense TaxID=1631346 RepID=UPI00065E44C4|nr:RNA polymerase sigma factor SigW [Rubeoparvulum massiliense]
MEYLEKQLIQSAKDGDQVAFKELVEIYKDKVFQLAYRMLNNRHDAEDIGQETFLRVYANLSRYDGEHKVSTWIYRIATNLCIDRLRKKKPSVHLDASQGEEGLDWYSRLVSNERTPEQQTLTTELQGMVQEAISQLPDKYRMVIILRYIDDLSLQEISDVLNLPVSTIKTRIHRGREALRKKLRVVL